MTNFDYTFIRVWFDSCEDRRLTQSRSSGWGANEASRGKTGRGDSSNGWSRPGGLAIWTVSFHKILKLHIRKCHAVFIISLLPWEAVVCDQVINVSRLALHHSYMPHNYNVLLTQANRIWWLSSFNKVLSLLDFRFIVACWLGKECGIQLI